MKLPVSELAAVAVVDLVLHQRLADALHHAAVHLAAHDHRIEDAAEVVDHEIAVDRDLAGLRIDLELADMRAVRMARRLGLKLPVDSRPMPNFSVSGPIGA